ncbi:hypothetical protein SAMN05444672_101514 [Bacillus sp. OK838]|nr:hypothetical protein SAMN05444672_101514 [Bacillus sp. OK838]
MIIINNKHFFGNEKHLKCEKIIISLEKLATYLPAFFYAIQHVFFENLSQSRRNETLDRKFPFPMLTSSFILRHSLHLKKLKICMHK